MGLWTERTLHTPQQQLQLLPCRDTGVLWYLVALLVWKGKWGFEFSEKVRIPEAWYCAKPAYEVPMAVVP